MKTKGGPKHKITCSVGKFRDMIVHENSGSGQAGISQVLVMIDILSSRETYSLFFYSVRKT
jgi:hypothetical protein